MATLAIMDGNDQMRYLAALGSGSQGDPFRPQQVMEQVPHSTFYTGQINVATVGQIVQLPAFPLTVGVLIKALSNNNGNIYIGGSGVTVTTGFELDKSDSVLIRIDELSKLYITASATNEGICAIGV